MITQEQLKDVQSRVADLARYLDIEGKKIQVEEEELRTHVADFWDDRKRAERRYKELTAKGQSVTLEEVLCDMRTRDKNDATRAAAPCVPAADAVLFDNSALDPDQTVEKALEIIYGKLGKNVGKQ